ncbi:protein STPG4 [Discoglossus pictus]
MPLWRCHLLESCKKMQLRNPGKEKKKQFSGRDAWWINSLRDTPSPGAYDVRDFLREAQLNPVQRSYNFKGQGRKTKPDPAPSGELLLPGCYNLPDFFSLSEKVPVTYSFKNTSRQNVVVGMKDKDINTDPGQYDLSARPVESCSCKHFMFRSAVVRFPSIGFVPKEGPGPGDYHVKHYESPGISSSFKSKVPRIVRFPSKTPGPGTYEPTRQLPKQPPTVAKMGRLHGIFFCNSFEF